jgi:serine/threonine protein kinase/ABC-type branched-subunit amino acid transport system substrate-binding protein
MVGRVDPRVGSVLRGRYRLERVLGAGGMATVYLAVHRNGNRVAVKVLRPELSVYDEHRERFIRESYVANSIDHPGAVRVLDDDLTDDGAPFLVMELLRGETLEARLRRGETLTAAEALAVGYALCDLLAAAHAGGVVHRDIKPDNIFLTAAGELRLLDFGIARAREHERGSGTQTGHLIGTPGYLPPEQALGRRTVDGRTDLWAVGATLFALLTGRTVHRADAPEELVIRAATEPAPALQDICPEIHPAVARVIDKALAFAQDDRHPDAAAMRAALADAHITAIGAPIEATPLPRPAVDSTTLNEPLASSISSASQAATDPGLARTLAEAPGATTTHSEPAARPTSHAPTLAPPAAAPLPSPTSTPPPAAPAPAPIQRLTPPRRRAGLAALGLAAVVGLAALAWTHLIASPPPPRAAADPGAPADRSACRAHAECGAVTDGAPSICRKDQARCVPLAIDRCRVIADPDALTDDTTLWIGAMYPITDPDMAYGAESARLVELAHRDFSELTGGLPPARAGGRPRPIGVVLCDDTRDHQRIAAHLVDDVGVPAIIGFGRSQEVLDLARQHFVAKGVLALASNTASMISSIPHPPGEPRLVYRVTTSAAMTTPPKIALLRGAIEPRLRRGLGDDATLKIAVVRAANASGISHSDAIFSELSRTRGLAREEVREFVVADAIGGGLAVDAAPAAEIVAYKPHVVLDAGATTTLLTALERAWDDSARPSYIFGGVDADVLRELSARPGFSARMHMIASRTSATSHKVQARYRAAYGGVDEPNTTAYDAFYVLAYAAIAAGDQALTGRALARAIARLVPPGAPIEVGPAGIYPALNALARGDAIDLQGTLTTLDFDPNTGDATAEFALRCLSPGDAGTFESETRFDAATSAMTGPGACP